MRQLSRNIVKNLVIAGAMSVTALASWGVTVMRNPAVGIAVIGSCSTGETTVVADTTSDDDMRQCKIDPRQG